MQDYRNSNTTDQDGNPAGGVFKAEGVNIRWQDGTLGRGADRQDPNGAFVETVIEAARERLLFYQSSKFACAENAMAIWYLKEAVSELKSRTAKREAAGVEGTHEIVPEVVGTVTESAETPNVTPVAAEDRGTVTEESAG